VNALEAALRRAAAESRPALVAYLVAGYPDAPSFGRALTAVAGVADAVEVGVPFSDPMADGVTIQRASRIALERGATLRKILDQLRRLAPRPRAPLALMSYLNPLLAIGIDTLAREARESGVSALLVPDLPLEESAPLEEALAEQGIALVQFVSPVTPPGRLAALCRRSRGFVYAVTVTGVTGGRALPEASQLDYLERVRAASPIPVLAGFGIRDREQVEALRPHVDGVVVGSALVECVERGEDPAAFLRGLLPEGGTR
jgi:tryptophan synthase alpha chain